MITIIAGSRDITDYNILLAAIELCPWKITQVVSGCARGVDRLGEIYAATESIPLHKFHANWAELGKSAGYKRNIEMADNAEALLAITTGSPGTAHMIQIAKNKRLTYYVYEVNKQND